MNCVNKLLKYPGSAQWPSKRGTVPDADSRQNLIAWRTAQDKQLHPGAYRDQIQTAEHPPLHNNPVTKERVWGFLEVYIYFPSP